MSGWNLTDEIRDNIGTLLYGYLLELSELDVENEEIPTLNLSDKGISPSQLSDLLEEFGWERGEQEENGWEMDFWIPFTKHNIYYTLTLSACGHTFTLELSAEF